MALPFTNIDLLPDFARSTRLKNAKPAPKLPGTSIAAETFDKFGAPRKVALTLEAANQEQAAAVGRLKSRLILQVPATPINNTLTVDAIITNHYGTPQKSIALPETTNQQQTAADKFGALKKVVTKTDSTKESQAEVDSYGNIQKNLTTPDTIKQDQAIINRLNAQVSEQLKTEVVNQEQAALDRLNSRVMIPKDKILQTHEDHQVIGYGAPPPGPIVYKFTNGTPPNGTQCSYYNGVSTGFQLSTTLPGSIYSGVVPDGLVLTNTGAITGIPCTKGSQPFIVTATLSGNSTTMDYTTAVSILGDGSNYARSINDLNNYPWTINVVNNRTDVTWTSAISGGAGLFIVKWPANANSGNWRYQIINTLDKCALAAPYTLYWSLSYYRTPATNLAQFTSARLNNIVLYSSPSTYPAYYDNYATSGSITFTQNSTPNNCLLDLAFSPTAGKLTAATTAVLSFSCWPGKPPT